MAIIVPQIKKTLSNPTTIQETAVYTSDGGYKHIVYWYDYSLADFIKDFLLGAVLYTIIITIIIYLSHIFKNRAS